MDFNLFDMLGIDPPEPKEEAKKKPQPKKGATGKASNTPKAEVKHQKILMNTGFCHYEPEVTEAKTVSEISDMFVSEYPGPFGVCETGTGSMLVIKMPKMYERHAASSLKMAAGSLVVFGPYQKCMEEETTVGEALAAFSDEFPDFVGAAGYYDPMKKHLYPVIVKAEKEPEITFPLIMGFGEEVISMENVPESGDYKKEMKRAYEKAFDVKVADFHYNDATHKWMPVYETYRTGTSTAVFSKKEKTYALPVTVRVGLQSIILDADKFPEGTTSVTAEEVRVALESMYFEYSKERTTMEYDEKKECFIPILKTSTKGSGSIVFDHGFAEFTVNMEEKELVDFNYKLPPIPISLIDTVWEIGRKELPNETAMQLFYSVEHEDYFLYLPTLKVQNHSRVEFIRCNTLEQSNHLVADIHTHGMYPAFFSQIDDLDEKGWRIFMVMGKLDSKDPNLAFRVGVNGWFKELDLKKLFKNDRSAIRIVYGSGRN